MSSKRKEAITASSGLSQHTYSHLTFQQRYQDVSACHQFYMKPQQQYQATRGASANPASRLFTSTFTSHSHNSPTPTSPQNTPFSEHIPFPHYLSILPHPRPSPNKKNQKPKPHLTPMLCPNSERKKKPSFEYQQRKHSSTIPESRVPPHVCIITSNSERQAGVGRQSVASSRPAHPPHHHIHTTIQKRVIMIKKGEEE